MNENTSTIDPTCADHDASDENCNPCYLRFEHAENESHPDATGHRVYAIRNCPDCALKAGVSTVYVGFPFELAADFETQDAAIIDSVRAYANELRADVMERAGKLAATVEAANQKGPGQKERQEFAAVRRAEMVLLEQISRKLTKILDR